MRSSDHLYKRKNRHGKISPIWWCWAYDRRGKIVRESTGCTDKKAAFAYLAELERRLRDPAAAAASRATLLDALKLLVRDRKARAASGERSDETVEYYRKRAGTIRAHFGDEFPLEDLSPASVDRFITARREDKVSPRTIGKELGASPHHAVRTSEAARYEHGHHPAVAVARIYDGDDVDAGNHRLDEALRGRL